MAGQLYDDNVDFDGTVMSASVEHRGSAGVKSRAALLARKAQERARRKASDALFTQDSEPDNRESCLCANCGYIFFRKDDSEYMTCPHCQARHHFIPAEELGLRKQTQADLDRLAKLDARGRAADRRRQLGLSRKQDTSVNDAKAQASLQMGSAEYKEYVKDLQEQSPVAEDDKVHAELEQYNAEFREQQIAAEGDDPTGDLQERRIQDAIEKQDIYNNTVSELRRRAAYTPSKADDRFAEAVADDIEALHDPTVSDEEYEAVMNGYAY